MNLKLTEDETIFLKFALNERIRQLRGYGLEEEKALQRIVDKLNK